MSLKGRETADDSIALCAEATVRASGEVLYHSLVDSLGECALFAISPTGNIITWSTGAENTFGYTKAEIAGEPFALIFSPEDVAAGAPQIELANAHRGARADYERWHVRKDGTRFWGTNTVAPMYDSAGTLIGFTKLVTDMTEKYRASEALRESEERLRLLVQSIPDYAIFSLALDGTVTTSNAAAHGTFGYAEHEIINEHFAKFFTPEDRANGLPIKLLEAATELGAVDEERALVRKDGSVFLGSAKLSRLKPGSNGVSRGFVYVTHDITQRAQLAEDLRRRASLDALTELPNRTMFFEHVRCAINAIKRRPTSLFAVLFIDVDHFKQVNDTFGHVVADRLLGATARRLESCVRSEDMVSRIGGDEFAILLNGINDVADANDAADRIRTEMCKPIAIDSRSVRASVSVGIALGNVHYDRPEDILHDADMAMYGAKADGRGRSMIFSGEIGVPDRSNGRR